MRPAASHLASACKVFQMVEHYTHLPFSINKTSHYIGNGHVPEPFTAATNKRMAAQTVNK